MILTQDIATNIAAYVRPGWVLNVPNGATAEKIITAGLIPFHPGTVRLGGSGTIVDIKSGHRAFDVKSKDHITFYDKKPTAGRLKSNGKYFEMVKGKLWVRVPNSVDLPCRRSPVDMKNWKGDSSIIMPKAIQEYRNYASQSIKEEDCTEITTVLLIYGKGLGYKSVYIEEQDFSVPDAKTFLTSMSRKTKKKPVSVKNGYNAYDDQGKLLYSAKPYGKKSSINFLKRFNLGKGYLFVWPSTELPSTVTTVADWIQQGNHMVCV